MRSNERGYAVVWVLFVMAAFVAAFTSLEFSVEGRPYDPAMYWAFGISFGIASLGLVVEAKRDPYAASMVLTVVSFITGIITGSVAWFGQQPHPIALGVAILSTAAFLWCVVFLAHTQLRRETVPNLLRQRFDRSTIFEKDGVQFVATYAPTEIDAGGSFEVYLVAQNCWDAPRTLRLGLNTAARLTLERAGLHFAREPSVTLPGAAVAVLKIPVTAHPRSQGRFVLNATPKVEGSGGTRVRHWRARGIGMRIPGWLTAALMLAGVFAWGGGLRFKVRVRQNRYAVDAKPTTPEPTTEIVWRPGGGQSGDALATS